MAEPTKIEDALSNAQRAMNKLEEKHEEDLAKKRKKLNKEISAEKKKQDVKDINELSRLKKQKEAENQEYIQAMQELTVEEYATLMNKAVKDVSKEYKEAMKEANLASISEGLEKGLTKLGLKKGSNGGLSLNTDSLGDVASQVFKSAINTYTEYQSKINTRLLGYTDDAFKKIVDNTTKASPFYKNTDYLSNINKLVESGIVQNVEQRAFLETVKDELISTFDATNATLERLVRIQNEDSSAARAGMEAYLNRFLNSTYENTEYLTDLFDQTSAALEEATSLLTAEDSTAVEYVVQKWLGALYSEGMSSTGIQAIASAIGQLASGNITDLVGTGTGNLLAMASNGNLADYFKNGLTEASANILMESLVNYLTSLNSMGNNVVRSQLADVFGLSISDLRAASNIKTSDVTGSLLSYSDAQTYTGYLLNTAASRMNTAEFVDNFTNNLMFAFGSQIAESPALYGIYKAGEVLDSLTGGINVNLGFMSGTIGSMLQTASLLGSAVGLVGDIIGGAKLTGSLLSTYNSMGGLSKTASLDYTGVGLTNGSGKSESGGITNGNGSDIYEDSLINAGKKASDSKQTITGKSPDDDIEVVVPNIYKYLINTFDKKMDTLVALNASMANYSVVDQMGNNMGTSLNTIMNGTNVVVTANASENTRDLTTNINENVSSIYTLLNKIVNGESSLAVRDISTVNGMVLQAGITTVNALGVGDRR